MKKILSFSLLLFATLTLVLTGCSDDEDNSYDTVIAFENLPTKGKEFVTTYFSNAIITQVRQKNTVAPDGTLYNVYLSTNYKIDLDKNGTWTAVNGSNVAPIPASLFGTEIPTGIQSYVNSTYKGLGITEVEKKTYGYKVELSNDIDLRFDAKGSFIGIES